MFSNKIRTWAGEAEYRRLKTFFTSNFEAESISPDLPSELSPASIGSMECPEVGLLELSHPAGKIQEGLGRGPCEEEWRPQLSSQSRDGLPKKG